MSTTTATGRAGGQSSARVWAAAIRMDVRLQRRYGFWWATAFVIGLWIGVLHLVPDDLLGATMPYLLMADVEFFLFFTAGAVFFDKGERTLFALQVTPLRFRHYLGAKLLTMTGLAVLICAVVALVDYGPRFDALALLGGAATLAVLMVLAGFVTAPLFPTISEWLLPATLLLAVAGLPLLDHSGLVAHPLFWLVPTRAPLLLLGAAFGQIDLTAGQLAYALGYPAACSVGLCLLAARVFRRRVIAGEAGR